MGKKNQSIVVNIFITLLVVEQGRDFTSVASQNKKSYLGAAPRNFTRKPMVISLSRAKKAHICENFHLNIMSILAPLG